MSKSMNMLRTRRRDNNVKPNRRLDRKSSRGMIYENEELRLKTININAEVERGQSDIKKLKRENEMLKKEIWCLRDEYEKLDKLLKDKDIEFSSSSTTCSTSETESCSSCSEDSDQVETSQNLENVQKTNLKNLRVEFDHLSIVPEENSTENSDKNSIRASHDSWNLEKHIIKPDQSYPSFEILNKIATLPVQDRTPRHFFAPIKTSKSCDDSLNNEYLGPSSSQTLYESQSQYYLPKIDEYDAQRVCTTQIHHIYDNFARNQSLDVMSPLSKSSTDLIVKMDNKNFNSLTSSSFSNGGNLEELLNDIESISQDILKLSNPNLNYDADEGNFEQSAETNLQSGEKPYKSELNVVLMPTPMPLLGFEKYNNLRTSCNSVHHAKSLDNLVEPLDFSQETPKTPDIFFGHEDLQTSLPLIPCVPNVDASINDLRQRENPFFFGSGSEDYFNARYKPESYATKETVEFKGEEIKKVESCDSKINLIDVHSEQISSENEENLRFKTTKTDEEKSTTKTDKTKPDKKSPEIKTPKLSIRRKVSIHFKGKKDKSSKNKSLDDLETKTPAIEKKHSLFDIKFTTEQTKSKDAAAKTPGADSKKSFEATTPASVSKSDNRNSNELKPPCSECKSFDKADKISCEGKASDSKNPEKKMRKSASVSPDRKHVQVKDDKKAHKKHKKNEKSRNRRSTISNDRFMRERSFSVCTDRSLGLGFNSAFGMYDDCINSDIERTNSLSSCGTIKMRKMSNISNFPVTGKIPWCACWGNGCL